MPKQRDRPDPQAELWRAFALERARLEAERLREAQPEHDDPAEPDAERHPAPLFDQPGRRRPAWRLLAPALTLALGLAIGFALGATLVDDEPTPAAATRPPATQPAPAVPTSVVVRRVASSACLETARRADELISLLNRNRRSEAAELIVAYSVANRQCRLDSSP